MSIKLNVLISTFNERINNISNVILNQREDVSYIISHQYTDDKFKIIPENLIREDIFVSQIPGIGVTKSRNNAISLATSEIGVFSDDDVTYCHEYFDKIIEIFSSHTDLDVGIFKIKTPGGSPEYKKYPLASIKLKKLPFSVGTIEIAFRVKRVIEYKLRFDERFGAGKKLLIGSDESIFTIDCIKAGLNVSFFPEYIVNHPYESTVKMLEKYDIRRIYTQAAFDSRVNGWISVPKSFYITFRHCIDLIKQNKSPFSYLKSRIIASLYILLDYDKFQ